MNTPFKFELSIIGLGYVGLPLGLQFAKSGMKGCEDSERNLGFDLV